MRLTPMKTVRRLFYVDITVSVVFVSLAFLSLFLFIDLVDALSDMAKVGGSIGLAGVEVVADVMGGF
jgi:lipopolysaccharide export system permease protein